MRHQRWFWMLILVVAFALRAAVAIWWQDARAADQPFALSDSVSYWHLASCVANGKPFEYPDDRARIFRTPGYPLVLAPLFLANDEPSPLSGRMVGVVLGCVAVGEMMVLGHCLFGARTAVVTGLLAAVYPGAVAMSILVLSEALFCPLMVGQFICWVRWYQQRETSRAWSWAAAAGVLAGLATLARPSWIFFTPGALMFALLDRRLRNTRFVRHALITLLTFVVVMTPWWIRSYRLTDRFVLTTLQVGASLYDGISPEATGASNMAFTEKFFTELEAEYQGDSPPKIDFETELDRRLKQASIDWAQENPVAVVQLAGVKFVRMWKPWPNADEFGSWPMRLAVAAGFLPIFVAAVVGLAWYRDRGWCVWVLALPVFYFTALHVIFVSSIRYRQPAVLLLTVMAAAALMTQVTGNRQQRTEDREQETGIS